MLRHYLWQLGYTHICPRYCRRSVLGILSANEYYIQACVLGKDVRCWKDDCFSLMNEDVDEDDNENDNDNEDDNEDEDDDG